MKTPSLLLSKLVVAVVASFLFGLSPQLATAQSKSLRSSSDVEGDLLRARDRVEFNLGQLKKKFEKDPEKLGQTKLNYTTAWRDSNLFVDDLQKSIRDGKNPKASKLFSQRVERAQKSIDEFNAFADQSLYPPDKKPKFLPTLLAPLATSLIESIFTKINASIKESADERKARREELAAELDKIKFREFEKVPQ